MGPGDLEDCIIRVGKSPDADCFRALFDFCYPRLKIYYIRTGEQHAHAEEIALEAILRIWQHAHEYNAESVNFSAWCFGFVRAALADHQQAESKQSEIRLSEPPPTDPVFNAPMEEITTHEERETIYEAMRNLSRGDRELMRLHFAGNFSHKQISDLTGRPLGTVKSRMRKAVAAIRARLTGHGW